MYALWRGFPNDSAVKESTCNPGDTGVQSLGQQDPLEEGMATHSGILVWRFPWTEEPGKLQFIGSQRVGHDWVIEHASIHCERKPSTKSISTSITHAQSLQPCSTRCDPMDYIPAGFSLCPWDSPGKNTGMVLSSGDLPDLGIKPASPVSPTLQVDSLPTKPPGKTIYHPTYLLCVCGNI